MKLLNVLAVAYFLITGTDTVYWPCDTDDHCTAKNSSCSSVSSQCSCTDFDSVFSSDFSTCLKTSLIGDKCEESVQCNLMPTRARCKSGVCDCADGETYVRGHCRTLNGLNQHCSTDLDCYFGYDRGSVQCKENICTCANGYYQRHGNICRRKSMEIGDVCVVDTDCDALGENVKCKSLKCQIVNEIKSNVINNNTRETNINGNNNNNINSIYNSSSNNNKNTRTKTKRQTSTPTETTSNLSKSSPSESDFNIVTKLVNGLSTTLSNYNNYDIVNNNNNILSDTDDDDLNTEPKQELISSPAPTEKSREIAVQTSGDDFELKELTPKVKNVGTITSTASNSSRSRRPSRQQIQQQQQQRRQRTRPTVFRFNDDEKTISTLSNTDDDIESQQYGFQCAHNGLSCTGLPHSICSSNVCLCRSGYYNKNGKCYAELGEIAESSDECENQFDAETRKCICQKNFFYDSNLRGCRKPIQYHLSCTNDNQCSPFGAAYCHPQIPRRCTCKEYAEYDQLLQMCAYKTGLGSRCETNDGCNVEHSMCSNHSCVCKSNYIKKGDECLPGFGADCLDDDDCLVDNSLCATTSASNGTQDQSKTCQCRKGFVHFKDECLKEAETIEEECTESEQCKPLLASCVDNKCSCSDKQHFQNGRCETKKALNEVCTTASQCFVKKGAEHVECRNSVCQCKIGYRSDHEHRSCVASNNKNSSGRPSALKIITFILIGSAFLITSAAIKQAYY